MEQVFDIAIVGSGPAGISAAINAKIRKKSFVLLGARGISDKIRKAECINNYLGLPALTGEELSRLFHAHMRQLEIEIEAVAVDSIYNLGKVFTLTARKKSYNAASVIIATGVSASSQISGEERFLGAGVSYCATCDGIAYTAKTIAVIASAPDYEDEVAYLAKMASRVYFVPLYEGSYPINPSVEIVRERPVEIRGDARVSAIVFESGKALKTDGVFILKDDLSPVQLMYGLKEENGFVSVDRSMKTSIPGVFAAGDCVGRPFQYMKAGGEGNIAAHSAITYLAERDRNFSHD